MPTPLAFSKDTGEAIINARKLGLTQAACAAIGGVTSRTLTYWLHNGEVLEDPRFVEFAREFRRADASIEREMVKSLLRAANSGEKGEWRAAEAWLRAFRAEYRPTTNVNINEDRQALLDAIMEHVPPEAAEKVLAAIAAKG